MTAGWAPSTGILEIGQGGNGEQRTRVTRLLGSRCEAEFPECRDRIGIVRQAGARLAPRSMLAGTRLAIGITPGRPWLVP